MEGKDLDWSRRGPLPELPQRRVPDRSSFGRGMDAGSDAGSERGGRRSNFESDGKPRDFNNWERKGPLSPSAGGPAREGRPSSNDGPGSSFRRTEAAWGEGRSQDEGSRPPRPEHVRPEPAPSAADLDNQWRARMRPDETPKEPISPASPSATPAVPAAPAGRPKLNLTKRTVSETPSVPTPTTSDSKASPFGAARPIDTATRERQVEEKRQLAIRQKQEAAEKAKAEKAERAAEKQKQAKESASAVDHNGKDVLEIPRGGGNFEILQRAGEDGEVTADKEAEETPAAAPAEAKKQTNGWGAPAAEAGAAAGGAGGDDEGWSTVSVNKRNNRRGQTGRGFA
jgi:translation initiation factor 4B